MPPKAKYSKEEIIQKATEIIGEQGIEKLTARELAAALNTSVKPIFTAFENMEEVKQCCFDYAFEKYHSYFGDEPVDDPFKNVGRVYINFARKEPKLFQALFLKSQDKVLSFSDYMKKLDNHYEQTLAVVKEVTGVTDSAKAEEIYKNMWIYCTGIASLCATRQCVFSDEEIERLLSTAYTGFVDKLK